MAGDSNDILNTFRELVKALKSDSKSDNERFPVLNVVPEFDPSKRTQTIDMWLSKVNECAVIYNWTERQTIHYALPKLVGIGQKWYQGLPSLMFSWVEWQVKLRTAFPSEENYGVLLTEMLAKRARYNDSLEEYFYEKVILLNRCKIYGKNAVDCVLLGIDDRSVRTSAEAALFTDPDMLLKFLRNVKSNRPQERSAIRGATTMSDDKRSQQSVKHTTSSITRDQVKCFNCGESGHPFSMCKKPLIKCESCFKVGHVKANCPSKKDIVTRRVL